MTPARVTVLAPGLLTTIQDLGRVGYQHFGVPVGGALDRPACRVANRLVGNRDDAAVLEITINGPRLVFERESVIALTGADLSPVADGRPVPLWTATRIPAGTALEFGARRSGARTYLAVAGGIAVPAILGSRSTHLRTRIGGLGGRALVAGDRLVGGPPSVRTDRPVGRAFRLNARPVYHPEPHVRLILGPHLNRLGPDATATLLASRYTVSPHSDRMGFRLTGPPLNGIPMNDMISEATACGSLQVPPDGQLILLMADCQTTGGYPILGVVITVDLPLVAQLAPGDHLRFSTVDMREAHQLLKQQEEILRTAFVEAEKSD